jgi:zinc/manganese transport system ATP-binding protein
VDEITSASPAVRMRAAALRFGDRVLWDDLDLDVAAGEFLAVLGPNGSGKTTLLKVMLGLQPLSSGTVDVGGRPPRRGSALVGYVPQQRGFDQDLPLRGRDLVALGLDGHRWGLPLPSPGRRALIDRALGEVGALSYADRPVGRLSGGEQQRLRIAQALLGDPAVLLCDEPLLSLDLAHQQAVTALVDRTRIERGTAVMFVTHEVNPVLPLVDRILYLVDGRWATGSPDEVMTSQTLSELYRTEVDVLRVRGRIVVVGAPDSPHADSGGSHHHLGSGVTL